METIRVRNRLVLVWVCGCGFFFFVLLIQSLQDVFSEEQAKIAFQWLFPVMTPATGLTVGMWLNGLIARDRLRPMSDMFAYRLSIGATTVYFVAVALTIFLPTAESGDRFISLLGTTDFYLAPAQGIVAAVIAATLYEPSGSGVARDESANDHENADS